MTYILSIALLVSNLLSAVAQPVQSATVYIALGDSIAAGIGSSLPRERSYPALIGDLIARQLERPVRVENLATPGESASSFPSSNQMRDLRLLVDEVQTAQQDIETVTVSLGGNELLEIQDAPLADRMAALASFESAFPLALESIRSAVGADPRIFASTIYDPTGENPDVEFSEAWWIEQFNMVIRDASSIDGVTIVDVSASLEDDAAALTRYPVDVHPTNAGHARIAATFWQAMAYDIAPPQITVTSDPTAQRYTPTLRFTVSPDSDASTVEVVTADDATIYPPVEVNDGQFVALIDASKSRPESITIRIVATDLARNSSEIETQLTFEARP
ncbi:MAG: SGNH/GDSL hydrolase family protein [Thermomicrobiales bacterium]